MIPHATHDGRPMTKDEVARWMGYFDTEEMDRAHDALHRALCGWLGVRSLSLAEAAGEALTPTQKTLADLEEHAVCGLQRFLQHWRLAGQ